MSELVSECFGGERQVGALPETSLLKRPAGVCVVT